MSNELTKVEEEEGTLTLEQLQSRGELSKHTQEEFEELQSSRFLPRIQLMTGRSGKCERGEFPVNHYALVAGSSFTDIGAEVDGLVLAWRPKALEIDDEIVTVYDKKDPEFERISDRADNEKNSGCMWGYEYLMWVGSVRKFATFFCGTKSARREAPNLNSHMNKAVTLRSHYIETNKFSWQGIQVVSCSTPMPMPSVAALEAELEKFNNPPVETTERAEDDGRAI